MRGASLVVGAVAVAAASSVVVAVPATAAPVGFSVVIVAHTDFAMAENEFDSNLPACATGSVVDVAGGSRFTPWGGIFVGAKTFTCAGNDSGFTLRLTARFGGGGSRGSWTLADAWGDFAGAKGSGSLVGIPTSETSIDDIFTGTVR